MLILVRHAPPFRRWQRRLGERLGSLGHAVRFEATGAPVGRRLLALERGIYRIPADWDASEQPSLAAAAGAPDLTIVLAGSPPGAGLMLQFEIAGATGEAVLLAAARAGSAPAIVVKGGPAHAMRCLASGRPAMEDRHVAARALEDLLPRLVTLLTQAVVRLTDGEHDELSILDDADVVAPRSTPMAFLARSLRHKLQGRFGSARGRPDHWRLALRRLGEVAFLGLADDPACFRADPFLFEEADRLWLFYEEYPYGTRKGVIGCLAVPAAMSSSPRAEEVATRVVLEEPFHLSYPLVLRHAGAIYMLPEATAARRLQLYRADPFPHRWVPDAILVEGRRLADATPVLHEGRWWLFAACDDDGGSSWDQLHLFHAPDLLGPWTPHAGNPVLIDAGTARPAGLMWHEDGALMRPAQDCRTGYGDGLVICRVDLLDEGGYRQSVVRRVTSPPGFAASGLHTLNSAAGWEVVDLKGPHPR